MKTDIKVTGVRYFDTRRGTGYQCTTNIECDPGEVVEIWNDGMGGDTFLDGPHAKIKPYLHLTESDLHRLIDDFEKQHKPDKMYLVTFMRQRRRGTIVPVTQTPAKYDRLTDHYEAFEHYGDAKDRYEKLLKEDWLHSASISKVIESTDYDYNKIVKEENNNAKLVS